MGVERERGGVKATLGKWLKESSFSRKTFLTAFTFPFSSLLFASDQHRRIDSHRADFTGILWKGQN